MLRCGKNVTKIRVSPIRASGSGGGKARDYTNYDESFRLPYSP
jgi:hypothetical protein